jgi:dienelactone hydrolase
MLEKLVEYTHEEALLEGLLCAPEDRAGPCPGVLILHAWAGRSAFECNRARALAARGYAAFAADLYGRGVLGSGPAENAALMQPFLDDRARLQGRLKVALACFARQPGVDPRRIVAIGFCFGGLGALDMARSGAAVQGVVSFHGLLDAPDNLPAPRSIRAKVLALHGHEDPLCPPEKVAAFAQEMTRAGADWQLHAYGQTLHAFTNPEARQPDTGNAYSETADRRSWQSLLNFLEEVID